MSAEPVFHDLVDVEVVDRSIFYNNSAFDGFDPAANAADDAAIATDKQALLPGQRAAFANYTSYSRGINGVMIDVAGLPSETLTADDFTFRVGNVDDTASWVDAPEPTAITLRLGAGADGSTRIEIVWPDGAIQKTWLEVTLKATAATGLAADDVFFFGNAPGESGNNPDNAIVDDTDRQGPLDHHGAAAITSPYDYNRDGLANAVDAGIADNNSTTSETALALVTPEVEVDPAHQRMPIELFHWGDGGHSVYYAPTLVTTNSGVVLAFAEGRKNETDGASYSIVQRRSFDGGATWTSPAVVVSVVPSGPFPRLGSPTPVVDRVTGDVFLLYNSPIDQVWVTKTSDDGASWSVPVNITTSVKVTDEGNPGPPGMYPDTPWGWNALGPGNGIQLEHGAHAGRLLIPADHRTTGGVTGKSYAHVIYSDDHGQTWRLGGGFSPDPDGEPSPNDNTNENALVELSDGTVYMSSRMVDNTINSRGKSFSTDGGITWTTNSLEHALTSTNVQGSLLRLNDDVILFASPSNRTDNVRQEMTIWVSYDDAQTWSRRKVVFWGFSGYSGMTKVGPDTVLLAFNRGHSGGTLVGGVASGGDFYQKTGLVRINLRWLESDDPYRFEWFFNEGQPGMPANTAGAAIQDYGPWDQRGTVAGSPPSYVAGRNGDSALELTEGDDRVVLTKGGISPLQLKPGGSFTAELMIKTTDDNGILVGTRPNVQNWTLEVIDGRLRFSLFDTINTVSITTNSAINDGQWHHIAAVRDANNRLIRLYVDGVSVSGGTADTTVPRLPSGVSYFDAVVLGSYNDLNGPGAGNQLAVTIDTVRFTHAALAPQDFLPVDLVSPTPPPSEPFAFNAPTAVPGLEFWLPAYHPDFFFGDHAAQVDPLPLVPFEGMSTRSMRDASQNGYRVYSDSALRSILYSSDGTIGSHWRHLVRPGQSFGSGLRVPKIDGPDASSFDFIQNTGVFTMSVFAKIEGDASGVMTLFDTSNARTDIPGFSLFRDTDGSLSLLVTANHSVVRFEGATPAGVFGNDGWYHIAIAGSGPDRPVQFYVTPLDDDTITSYTSANTLTGADGDYPTGAGYDLFIGSRSFTSNTGPSRPSSFAPFVGGLVNESIYSRALSPLEIQQLFLHGKSVTPPRWQNPLNRLDVNNSGSVSAADALIVINHILMGQAGTLPDPGTGNPEFWIDTNGNNVLQASDVLQVINYLLMQQSQSAEPNDTAPAPQTQTQLPAAESEPLATPVAEAQPTATAGIAPARSAVPLALAMSDETDTPAIVEVAAPAPVVRQKDKAPRAKHEAGRLMESAEATVVGTQRTSNAASVDSLASPVDAYFESLGS